MGSGESWLYDWFYDNQIINETPTIWENFRLIPGTAGIVTGGNPTILGKNLLKELDVHSLKKWPGYQAHHIIPKELSNHPILKKMGIDLDDSSNGIFLRIPGNNVSVRSRHRGYHSVYSKFVKQKLDSMNANDSITLLQFEVRTLQLKLRELQSIGLPMYESGGATIELWNRYFEKLQ